MIIIISTKIKNNIGWPVGPIPSEPTQSSVTQYRLHLPNYNGVLEMAVGVPEQASLYPGEF